MRDKYLLVPDALADLQEIWSYIARDNVAAADRVEAHIRLACEFVAEHPMIGNLRRNVTSRTIRFWTLTQFPNLNVLRILHGAMDLPRRL